ncbi:MAG: class I SAM-dependent methyltransferase [Acidithiobacillus sp.]|uniref:class I SAM-dependent methyltransferase n=1 Tax=Acidithiobacillus sp. TaxID=1872118 RepID=UPI0025C255A1|nr:methyltransferase domain-containing protein [Acidithiobacillus sp.]
MSTPTSRPGFWHFTREFLRDPRAIGAVFPSSPYLARKMAGLVPAGDGFVLELGPGLGPVTRALLERGVAPADLILVERSPRMVAHLRRRFPGVEVIEGDAARLEDYLGARGTARAIVSSLPLRSMPASVVRQILDQFPGISRPGTVFIQFTYHPRSSCHSIIPQVFEHDGGHFVWRNLPPARVDSFSLRHLPS